MFASEATFDWILTKLYSTSFTLDRCCIVDIFVVLYSCNQKYYHYLLNFTWCWKTFFVWHVSLFVTTSSKCFYWISDICSTSYTSYCMTTNLLRSNVTMNSSGKWMINKNQRWVQSVFDDGNWSIWSRINKSYWQHHHSSFTVYNTGIFKYITVVLLLLKIMHI